MEEKFIAASRAKLRFDSTKGQFSVEDLWDLSLVSLDTLAKSVNKQIKDSESESFIGKKTNANTVLELKLDVLKYVIEVKMTEEDAKKTRVANQQQLTVLKNALANKKADAINNMDEAELAKQIAALEA